MDRRLVFAAGLAMAAACGHVRSSPVPLHGERELISSLAGKWRGEYESAESGRGGSITFVLRAGTDSATGDVLMEPRGTTAVVQAADLGKQHLAHSPNSQLLAISFVGLSADEVSGALEPYIAPDCACTVSTTFRGRVAGDSIVGTFTTTAPMLTSQHGRWRMVREQP